MIRFYGRMYDATANIWYDDSDREYSIATFDSSVTLPSSGQAIVPFPDMDKVQYEEITNIGFVAVSRTNYSDQAHTVFIYPDVNNKDVNIEIRFNNNKNNTAVVYLHDNIHTSVYLSGFILSSARDPESTFEPMAPISYVAYDITNDNMSDIFSFGSIYESYAERGRMILRNALDSNSNSTLPFKDYVDTLINIINVNPASGDPGGNSDTGGGTGDFDNSSDNIDFSELPILNATDAGFVTIYTPTTSQLKQLAQYMWTTDFVDVIKKLFGDPMDAILGLSIVPVSIPTSGEKEVTVGFVGTGVTMPVASDQYIGFDCGTLNIKEYWGSALDYSPYTKANIFLPYIGFRQLSVDDIMGKAVHLKYRIDILSGACTAQIKCGGSVIYQFSGSCSASLPVSGRDFSDIVRNAITIAGATGAMIASGGMSAPISAGVVAAGLTTTANNVMGMKPHTQHSGAVSGTGGLLGLQVPFIVLERPRQSLAKGYKSHLGYPSNISSKLSDLKGYTRVEEIHLEGMTCTDKEVEEIYQKLKQGVII